LRTTVAVVVVLWGLATDAWPAAQPDPDSPDTLLIEAAGRFHNADYEEALPILTRLVDLLASRTADEAARDVLIRTYEMRGRTEFALGRRERSRADFESLLRLAPGRTLPAVSPAVERLFAEVRREVVGELSIGVEPPDARLAVDGVTVTSDTPLPVVAGRHTISASRVNYAPTSAEVIVPAGELSVHAIALERVLASVRITTVPPDVDVLVNGTARGRTRSGAVPPEQAAWARSRSIPPERLSTTLELNEFVVGTRYELQFRKACFATVTIVIEPQKATNLRLEAIVLEDAVGTLVVTADVPDADVLVDGELRGTAPLEVARVCEGTHEVEFRTPTAADAQRVEVARGQRHAVHGMLKPRNQPGADDRFAALLRLKEEAEPRR
jgi:hypothetical protein